MRALLASAAVVFLLLGATVGPMWADEDAPAAKAEKDDVEIVISEPVEVEHFLKTVQKTLDVPLSWDPRSRALQGKEVLGGLRFAGDRKTVFEAVCDFLTAYELVVIPIGAGGNTNYFVADARQTQAILRLKPQHVVLTDENLHEYEDRSGLFVTATIQVRHLDNLRDARNALNRIVTGQNIGNVTEVPSARAFVVADFAPNVVAIYRLLREMDTRDSTRGPESGDREVGFEAIALKSAMADDVAALLIQQFGANEPRVRKLSGPRTPQQSVSQVPPEPVLRIAADPRLNQVLLTGMRKDVRRAVQVIADLDRPTPMMTTHVEVLRLAHVSAVGAAAALNSLIQRFPDPWLAEPGVRAAPVVEAHPETNSLLVHGGEGALKVLRRVVADLDVPRTPAEEETEEK